MRLVVIESPYAGNVLENLAYAKACVKDCLARGESPYASHLFFTQEGLLDDMNKEERQLGIRAGLAWARNADASCFYVDRGFSEGMAWGLHDALFHVRKLEFRSLRGWIDSSMHEHIQARIHGRVAVEVNQHSFDSEGAMVGKLLLILRETLTEAETTWPRAS